MPRRRRQGTELQQLLIVVLTPMVAVPMMLHLFAPKVFDPMLWALLARAVKALIWIVILGAIAGVTTQ